MFCPRCRSEYEAGHFRCPDCDISLVTLLPEEGPPQFVDYEEILSTFNPADIALVKSILDAEDIIYFFKGEHFTYVRPFADPARLMVARDQADEARELLKDLDLSYMGVNMPDEEKEDGSES